MKGVLALGMIVVVGATYASAPETLAGDSARLGSEQKPKTSR
jgi:hypothetical protein